MKTKALTCIEHPYVCSSLTVSSSSISFESAIIKKKNNNLKNWRETVMVVSITSFERTERTSDVIKMFPVCLSTVRIDKCLLNGSNRGFLILLACINKQQEWWQQKQWNTNQNNKALGTDLELQQHYRWWSNRAIMAFPNKDKISSPPYCSKLFSWDPSLIWKERRRKKSKDNVEQRHTQR